MEVWKSSRYGIKIIENDETHYSLKNYFIEHLGA
jgi:hypothetical protein